MDRGRSPGKCDPIDDPEYLRSESRRLRDIIKTLSDPEIKKELAAHSFQLAQRAEAIARITEDPAIIRMNIERYRSILESDAEAGEKRTVQILLDQAEQSLDGPRTLRELAAWCRDYAKRAANAAIWEARLLTADNLDAEAVRLEQRSRRIDPDHTAD